MIINQLVTMRGAKLAMSAVAGCFLLIHVALLYLFQRYGVTPMAYFNVFSIAFYAFCFYMVHREWLKVTSIAIYLEVVVHMVLAVHFVGWECGFQITLIGMMTMLFFSEYVGRILQVPYVHALPFAILGMVAYVGVYIAGIHYPPPYTLPDDVEFILEIAWGVVVFAIVMVALQAYVFLTFKSEARLSTQVVHDALTGLPNRYYMTSHLSNCLAEVKDHSDKGFWLAICDIDNFKSVNDTYGHNCGDFVLKTLGEIMAASTEGLQLCRWGGEEFLLVGPVSENGGMDEAYAFLDRLRATVSEHVFWYEETRLAITVTIGLAQYVQGESAIEWVNAADKMLYAGKTNGKNQVVM